MYYNTLSLDLSVAMTNSIKYAKEKLFDHRKYTKGGLWEFRNETDIWMLIQH